MRQWKFRHQPRRCHHYRSWKNPALICITIALVIVLAYFVPAIFTLRITSVLITAIAAIGAYISWKKWIKYIFLLVAIGFALIAINPMFMIYAIILLIGAACIAIFLGFSLIIIFLKSIASGAGFGVGFEKWR